ncbi:MAG: hypothetical protein M9962_07640 [Oligoflexia bacterium]|nr:hypothetical protein [Oligoflexia bacterium]
MKIFSFTLCALILLIHNNAIAMNVSCKIRGDAAESGRSFSYNINLSTGSVIYVLPNAQIADLESNDIENYIKKNAKRGKYYGIDSHEGLKNRIELLNGTYIFTAVEDENGELAAISIHKINKKSLFNYVPKKVGSKKIQPQESSVSLVVNDGLIKKNKLEFSCIN